MSPQEAADLIAKFAQDPTYERYRSLRAMMAVQIKNKIGERTPEQKLEIWRLIPPEHQKAFKDSLAIARQIDERTYPPVEKLPDKSTDPPEEPPSPL